MVKAGVGMLRAQRKAWQGGPSGSGEHGHGHGKWEPGAGQAWEQRAGSWSLLAMFPAFTWGSPGCRWDLSLL